MPVDAAADISVRIALRAVAAVVSFAIAAGVFHWKKSLRRPDFLAAAVLFWPIFAVELAVMTLTVPVEFFRPVTLGVYILVFAGAIILAARGCRRGVWMFALALALKVVGTSVLLWGWNVVVE
ncbi:MAG: hypothetical protein J7M19_07925 [Planctomycetes bacterium]|nr:hypothetical protein [Planctomycetota bacterium]